MFETVARLKQVILALTIVATVPMVAAQAQQYPDLGHSLYARGYTGTVWVNSFQSVRLYSAHGDFNPDVQTQNGNYESRYGMTVAPASGTVVANPDGGSDAHGTATNPNSVPSEGSILIELDQNGAPRDSALVDFIGCAPGQACPWTAHFITTLSGTGWSVSVIRHVQGSLCGGESNLDLNGPCHDTLVSSFQLAPGYVFTSEDLSDTNYVSLPGDTTSALCSLIKPICGGPPPPPAISVSGPSSGQVNQAYTFAGAAFQCTANANGWTWSVSGGSISGSSKSGAVSVSWASTGSKTISATNTGCPGAQGAASITVSDSTPPPFQAKFTSGPTAPTTADAVHFDATSSTGVPAGASYGWDFGDQSSGNGAVVTHTYAAAGTFTVQLSITPPGCPDSSCRRQASATVVVAPVTSARFTFSPPSPFSGQVVTFDASSSILVPAGSLYAWDFGDGGAAANGQFVMHAFAQQGSYDVALLVTPPGCGSPSCVLSTGATVAVAGPPTSADFTTDAPCQNVGGFDICQATIAKAVTLTATETAAASYTWDFGDGKATAHGKSVSHAWAKARSYVVALTVSKNGTTAAKVRTFEVALPPNKTVLIPWVFDSAAPLLQSNDLYLYNPSVAPLGVTLEFRRRGTVEDNPPRAASTIAPHATAYLPDVLNIFGRTTESGFVTVISNSATIAPIVTALDSSARKAGRPFTLAVPGASLDPGVTDLAGSPVAPAQHLVGLNDTGDRQSSFGISNPGAQAATYQLKLFAKTGDAIGQPTVQNLGPHSQRLFSVQAIRAAFGVAASADYRVEVDNVSGPQVFPFASDVRLATGDISFAVPGSSHAAKTYLLGAINGAGLAGRSLMTDVLLANVGDQTLTTTLSFTRPGKSRSTAPAPLALQGGKTQRLQNVLLAQFGLKAGSGVLTLTSTSADATYPIVLGESYDNSNPLKRFGQTILPLTDDDAAGAGMMSVLVGLRQDVNYNTTLWLFNPGAAAGQYDLVYRRVDGTVLGILSNIALAAGAVRQFDPAQHPIKKPGTVGGFTVEVVVKSGRALAAAQVVNLATSDPGYVPGVAR